MNFLVIDDNRLLNRFLTTYLRGKGHVASSLTDTAKVAEWLDRNPCDCVIVGIKDKNGSALVEAIRSQKPEIVIAIFSGLQHDDTLIESANACGADGFISKGSGPSEIHYQIMQMIGKKPAKA